MTNTVVGVSQAADLVRKDRQTLYNHQKLGKLSFVRREDDSYGVELAELQRCYGKLHVSPDELKEHYNSANEPALDAEIERLKAEIDKYKIELEHRNEMIEEIKTSREDWRLQAQSTARLLEHQTQSPAKSKRRFFGLLQGA